MAQWMLRAIQEELALNRSLFGRGWWSDIHGRRRDRTPSSRTRELRRDVHGRRSGIGPFGDFNAMRIRRALDAILHKTSTKYQRQSSRSNKTRQSEAESESSNTIDPLYSTVHAANLRIISQERATENVLRPLLRFFVQNLTHPLFRLRLKHETHEACADSASQRCPRGGDQPHR